MDRPVEASTRSTAGHFVLLLSAGLLGGLVGCGSDEDQARWSAQKVIAARMKDPDSAKFRDVYTVDAPSTLPNTRRIAVCGVVDGKNSFGTYTGGDRFVVLQSFDSKFNTQDTVTAEVEPADRRATPDSRKAGMPATVYESVYWNRYCVDASHPPTFTGI
ncbi:hypothetical protein SAMN05428957_10870 [Oryzisolibacter propanilivorax]|uniref:Lipoprotein n=1 Tax=Oryzisolibacter propanilivorax TaxID=1527607 RepID=A0A1G9UA92_9BURK|nr:hypothetical protein SAMN05428957_10870 [Oryzisolibacter propanilivorax]